MHIRNTFIICSVHDLGHNYDLVVVFLSIDVLCMLVWFPQLNCKLFTGRKLSWHISPEYPKGFVIMLSTQRVQNKYLIIICVGCEVLTKELITHGHRQ